MSPVAVSWPLFLCFNHSIYIPFTVAWSPDYIKDKQVIKKIQRRYVKMIPGFRHKSYEKNLRNLRVNTLEEKRNQADLIF